MLVRFWSISTCIEGYNVFIRFKNKIIMSLFKFLIRKYKTMPSFDHWSDTLKCTQERSIWWLNLIFFLGGAPRKGGDHPSRNLFFHRPNTKMPLIISWRTMWQSIHEESSRLEFTYIIAALSSLRVSSGHSKLEFSQTTDINNNIHICSLYSIKTRVLYYMVGIFEF